MRHLSGRWGQRGAGIVAILTLVAMLTACVEAGTNSTIGPDLKGTTTMRVGISKSTLQLIAAFANSNGPGTPAATPMMSPTDDPFSDLVKQVSALGGTAKPFDDGAFVGEDILFGFSSLDEMQKQINTVLGSSGGAMMGAPASMGMSGMGTGMGMSDLAHITAKSTDTGIRIDGTVDPLSFLSDPSAASGAPPGVDLKALLASGGTVDLSFTMPGAITTADDLATQDGNTVSWSFKVGDKAATIFAESAKP